MPQTVDPQAQAMLDNMPEKTGKSLDEWFKVINARQLKKYGEIMKLLKGEFGVTHGYANTITLLFRQAAEGGPKDEADLIAAQYADAKAGLRPIYQTILNAIQQFGSDVEIAPKKTYVSIRRNKQFAIVQASTKDRVDLGLNLKDLDPIGRLEGGKIFGGMCTHLVRLTSPDQVDQELIAWLRQAYEQA